MTRTRKREKPPKDDDYFGLEDSPDASPTLTASQLCWNGEGVRRKDLFWWLDHFAAEGRLDEDGMLAHLKDVLTEAFGKPVKAITTFLEFTSKHRFPSLDWQAACWNEALSRGGFDVPASLRKIPKLEQTDESDDEDE